MSRDAAQFLKFLAAMFLPALIAGSCFEAHWAKSFGWIILVGWFVATLGGIGYVVDGGRGAKALLAGTAMSWGIMAAIALVLGTLVALKFG